jgi:hypothetical protein
MDKQKDRNEWGSVWEDPHNTANTRRHGLNAPSASTIKKERPTTFNNTSIQSNFKIKIN